MENRLAGAREAATAAAARTRSRSGRGRRLHVRHAARRGGAVRGRASGAAREARLDQAVRGDVAPRRDRGDGRAARPIAPGCRRAVVVFTDGTDNWSRLTPRRWRRRPAPSTCRSTSSGSCRSSTTRRRRYRGADGRSGRWSTAGSSNLASLDRRAQLQREHGGRSERGGAADSRGTPASVCDRVRGGQPAGLASAGGSHAQQGSGGARAEWVQRGAISPDFVRAGGSHHVPQTHHGRSHRGARRGRDHGVRDEEVRAHERG